MQVDWELSQTLPSLDGLGVRAACVLSAAADGDAFSLVAGTQGGSLVSFGVPSGQITPVPFRHNHAVTALLAFPDRSCYVTGCKDAAIRIFDAATHELQATLEGHDKPVTSLSWCSLSGALESTASLLLFLVSGSWDGTAKVWDVTRRVLVATLAEHENSVCCVGLTNSDTRNNLLFMATGSAGVAQNNRIAGHTVRLWSVDPVTGETNLLRKVANDHEGPIRGITLFPTVDSPSSLTLATCSNDGTVKLRSGDTAECFATLTFMPEHQQHPPMLLAVTTISNNDTTVAACAEDGHVVLWDVDGNSTKPPLLVTHATCVWNLVALPNNDFATCCDDGHLRIFTRASERMAAQEERDTFVTQVAQARQKAAGGPTPQEVAKLPRWETSALQQGSSEGQVHLFQKDGIAIAAQWSMASRTWIEVGQVMGNNNANTGVIDGVSYDHVLPIEVDQAAGAGVANLQIGYNNGENPFVAAQRFIDAHVLPQYHLAQIADYIQHRVGGGAPTLGATASATPSTAVTGVPIASFQYLPIQAYKVFDLPDKAAKTTLEKIKTKIQGTGQLNPEQTSRLESLLQTLAATNRYHSTKVPEPELQVLVDLLQTHALSPADAFPALDLARMAVLHPDAVTQDKVSIWTRLLQQALVMSSSSETATTSTGPAAVAVPMLSLRLFANAFKGGPGSLQAVEQVLDSVVACAEQFVSSGNKNIRLSVATVVHNMCFYLHSSNATVSPLLNQKIVSVVHAILSSKAYEGEAVYRTLLGVGTLLMASSSSSQDAKDAAKQLYLSSKVELAASPHGANVKAVAKEVYAVLSR